MIPAGHVVAVEQWKLPVEQLVASVEPVRGKLMAERTSADLMLTGSNFRIGFSLSDGEMTLLEYNGRNLVKEGLQANFWRGLTDNDVANGTPERCGIWHHAGKNARLKDLKLEEAPDKQWGKCDSVLSYGRARC